MVLLLLAVVQVGLWFHCRSVATTAARHGVDEVRVIDGSAAAGIAAASAFLDQAGASLQDASVSAARGETNSSVTVSGNVVSVIPGVNWSLSVTVDAPTERLEVP